MYRNEEDFTFEEWCGAAAVTEAELTDYYDMILHHWEMGADPTEFRRPNATASGKKSEA